MAGIEGVRPYSFIDLGKVAQAAGGIRRAAGRAANFQVEWIEAEAAGAATTVSSREEIMLLLPDGGARLEHDGRSAEAPGHAVAILPAGETRVVFDAPSVAAALTATPDGRAANEAAYADRDPRIAPVRPMRRTGDPKAIAVHELANVPLPPNGRQFKILQSAVTSINWAEYEGPRDPKRLTPHNHDDIEQGSLVFHGTYLQHMRVPWTPDSTLWRDDVHLPAGPGTLTIFPVELIHTSEAVSEGRNILIDIFSPPRFDFIEQGWVHNSADYER